MVLEICVDNFESAKNADLGGADRIELCAALSEDGLTPSTGMVKQCLAQLSLQVFAMIRPRKGDFVYSADEIQIMLEDIRQFKAIGIHGIVVGVLQKDRQIDKVAMRKIIDLARPLPVTFHRAFDHTIDPYAALNTLMDLQVDRLLTSGQMPSAAEGKELIKELVDQSSGRIIIMPGAGLKSSNIEQLFQTGAVEYHGSARKPGLSMSSKAEIQLIKSLLDNN